jgi:hypothetical protein
LPSVGVDWGREAFWESVGKLPQRLKGRVLGASVRKGMTQEQVEQVLGPGVALKPLPSGGVTGGGCFSIGTFTDYPSLGVSVKYSVDEDGILRVSEVTYQRLFE